ncbi:MAG: hypothetical protein GY861_01780 [bacterium]|nr:hypothetical protein [bacterium]
MKTQFIPQFNGINTSVHPRVLPDDKLSDGENIIFKEGKVRNRWGYEEFGTNVPLNGSVKLIRQYDRLRSGVFDILVFTAQDAYALSGSTWKFITPVVNANNVTTSGTGDRTVTVSSATWDSTWPDNQYYIGFSTTDLNAVTTWYEVESFDSTTICTLAEDGPSVTAVTYVIRKCFNMGDSAFFDMTFAIEDWSGDAEKVAVVTNCLNGDVDNYVLYYDGADQLEQLDTAISGTDVFGKYIVSYHDHLLFGWVISGATNYPQSVYWSARTDPQEWATGSASYADLVQGGEITGMVTFKQRLYVFKKDSIIECRFTGLSSPAFQFAQDKIKGIGCPNSKTIVNFGEFMIFQGEDNLYVFNGFQCVPVGGEMVQDIILNQNDYYHYKNFAFALREEYLYCLAVVSGTATEPNKIYCYNYKTKQWTIWEFADTITCNGMRTTIDITSWDDAVGTWAAYLGVWSVSTSERPTQVFGDENGLIYDMNYETADDNGTDIVAFIETKDFDLNEYNQAFKLLETALTLEDGSGSIQISTSIDSGTTWSDAVIVAQNTAELIYEHTQNWLRRGRKARFRIENVSGSEFALESLRIGFESAGI